MRNYQKKPPDFRPLTIKELFAVPIIPTRKNTIWLVVDKKGKPQLYTANLTKANACEMFLIAQRRSGFNKLWKDWRKQGYKLCKYIQYP